MCLIFKGNYEYIFYYIFYIVSRCQLILPSLYVDLVLCSCNIMRKIIEISKHCVWRVYSLQFSISTSSALWSELTVIVKQWIITMTLDRNVKWLFLCWIVPIEPEFSWEWLLFSVSLSISPSFISLPSLSHPSLSKNTDSEDPAVI